MTAKKKQTNDPLADFAQPSLQLLVKIGSALVHAEEYHSPKGHPLDLDAFKSAMTDPEIQNWISAGTENGLLPVKR